MKSDWWWSGLKAGDESPLAGLFISTWTSTHLENAVIPPRPTPWLPLLSTHFPLVDLIFLGFVFLPGGSTIHSGGFPDLYHLSLPWSLCWALKLYPQLLLDNPSQSTIDTSHSTNIIWTYHSPLATPKETLILLLVNGITIYSVSQATNWRVKDNSFLHSPHSPTQ